jgi:molybdenum cofactor guanylyltransferase
MPDKSLPPLLGLVLTGGRSTRMGRDKSLIVYHEKPQREHLTALLRSYCTAVFWSVNAEQSADLAGSPQPIIVDADTGPGGPLNGILSAFRHRPDAAWFVVACDLPFLDWESLSSLQNERTARRWATVFQTPGQPINPVLSIWEPAVYEPLLAFAKTGRQSPRQFLEQHADKVKKVKTDWRDDFVNVNEPEQVAEVMRRLAIARSYPPLTFFAADNDPYDLSHACPICGQRQPASPRYSRYLCRNCVNRATDEASRRVSFKNAGMAGGLLVRWEDAGQREEVVGRFITWVDGVRCRAEEGRFGGIVVQTDEEPMGA